VNTCKDKQVLELMELQHSLVSWYITGTIPRNTQLLLALPVTCTEISTIGLVEAPETFAYSMDLATQQDALLICLIVPAF
jgi:hypothetical protein